MYKIKLTLAFIALLISNIAESQTLHAIIFADTYNYDIGASVREDYSNMVIEFFLIAEANKLQLKIDDSCIGENFNRQTADKVLNDLKCDSNDIVFFYYSGHSNRSDSQYPQLGLKSNAIALHTVDEIIASKNPRLRIIMADCRNGSIRENIKPQGDLGYTSRIDVKSETLYQNLFGISKKGSIIIASSQAGENSVSLSVGGAFTFNFLQEMQKMKAIASDANWNTLLEKTRDATYRLAGHTPIFSININESDQTQPYLAEAQKSRLRNVVRHYCSLMSDYSREAVNINLRSQIEDLFTGVYNTATVFDDLKTNEPIQLRDYLDLITRDCNHSLTFFFKNIETATVLPVFMSAHPNKKFAQIEIIKEISQLNKTVKNIFIVNLEDYKIWGIDTINYQNQTKKETTQAQINGFQEEVNAHIERLQRNLEILTDKNRSNEVKQHTHQETLKLFIEQGKSYIDIDDILQEPVQMRVASAETETITSFPIDTYLTRLRNLYYAKVEITKAETMRISNLYKIDDQYYASATIFQRFYAYDAEGLRTYVDHTVKTIQVILHAEVDAFGENWVVLLGNIDIVETI